MESYLKVCTKCFAEKSLESFSRSKKGKYGRESVCKICRSEYKVNYNKTNAVVLKEKRAAKADDKSNYDKLYRKSNSDAIRKRKKIYHEENREAIYKSRVEKGDFKKYREKHRESILSKQKAEREGVSNSYVKKILIQQNVPVTHVTLDIKKEQLSMYRLKRKIKNYVKQKTTSASK